MNNTVRVYINIVAWNSMRFLPELMKSIQCQTAEGVRVLVIDNGSSDDLEPFLRQQYPDVMLLSNRKNLGFSAAHNQGIRYALEHWPQEDAHDRFVLVTNPDCILTPFFLEKLFDASKRFPMHGSFGGKVLRAFSDGETDEAIASTLLSDQIDSTGFQAKKNRTVIDRGAGEVDVGQFDMEADVFGISGALALYRAQALADVRYRDEIFDHDFFAYKEDVDLAWRLQQCGWKARYLPDAIAYHHRGMFGAAKMSFRQRRFNRSRQDSHRVFWSTRNHLWVLLKNLTFLEFFTSMHRLLLTEGLRFFYVCIWERSTIFAYVNALRHFPRMLKKRRSILKKRAVTFSYMRSWFV